PNGLRYLWTDAFGIVLLVSLYQELGRSELLVEAESVVAEVERVLGRPRADELPWKKRYACITCHAVSLLSRKCKTQG
ncbi:MAG TPA: hypothetical protein VMF50_18470, partial [Candidatus Binataceae bacterium]|nr:hypothetical protein [Candidatus Binataceae bacterium]